MEATDMDERAIEASDVPAMEGESGHRCGRCWCDVEAWRVAWYVLGAYAFTWGIGWPVVALQEWEPVEKVLDVALEPALGIAAFGPTTSAFVVVWVTGGWSGGVLPFLRRCTHLGGAGWHWLPLACVLFPCINAATLALYVYLGGGDAPAQISATSLLLKVVLGVFVGALGEEFGWRGAMVPSVQSSLHAWAHSPSDSDVAIGVKKVVRFVGAPLLASGVIGVTWALWHLPSFFIDALRQSYVNLGMFIVQEVLYSVWYTFFSNRTAHNITVAILMHASINASGDLVTWGDVQHPRFFTAPNSILTLVMLLSIAGLVWAWGGNLGWRAPSRAQLDHEALQSMASADNWAAT